MKKVTVLFLICLALCIEDIQAGLFATGRARKGQRNRYDR
jgi:hypothetical protein